jgi:hypothetical protein
MLTFKFAKTINLTNLMSRHCKIGLPQKLMATNQGPLEVSGDDNSVNRSRNPLYLDFGSFESWASL